MTCLVAYSKHDASRVFVRGIARKAGSPVRCQDSRTLTGSHNMLRRRFIGPFFGVFSVYKCLIVCVLSFTCACFARFVAIGFLQARCSSFGVLALKMFHFQDMTTSKIQVLHVHTRRGSSFKNMENNLQGSMLPKLEWPDWRAWNLLVQPWQLLLFCWELGEVAISATPSVVG